MAYVPDRTKIETSLRSGIGENLDRVEFEARNYGFSCGMLVVLKDGRAKAYLGGLINRDEALLDGGEDNPDWVPEHADLENAVPDAVEWARGGIA